MIKDKISKKILREFGILIGLGFPILIGFLFPLLIGHSFRLWTIFIAIPAMILGIFKPTFLFLPYRLWIEIGHILGWINSRVILGIVFFLVLLPISLLMKIVGYDPLKKNKSSSKTYKEDKKQHKIDLTKSF